MMLKKFGSIFGLVAIIAFFLPWLKACDKVESGFELLITDSLRNFDFSSLSPLNTGLLFILIPLFAILSAWVIKGAPLPKWYKVSFWVLSFLNLSSIVVWAGVEIKSFITEWGTTLHVHSMRMAKLSGIAVISCVVLIIFLFKVIRKPDFNIGWAVALLTAPLFAVLGIGFTFKPNFYGIWLYLAALTGIMVFFILDGIISGREKGSPSSF